MANHYNPNPQHWPTSAYRTTPPDPRTLQLEHEFDYTATTANQDVQINSNAQPFPDSFQYSQSHYQPQQPNRYPSQNPSGSFASNPGSLDGLLFNNPQNQSSSSFSEAYPTAHYHQQQAQFTSNVLNNNSSNNNNNNGHNAGVLSPEYFAQSPEPTHELVAFSRQHSLPHPAQPQLPHVPPSSSAATIVPPKGSKRQRKPTVQEEEKDSDLEDAANDPRDNKGKIQACLRCKTLKVKCDKVGFDSCKRCNHGGHECVIPGRKKRRAPPKREVLISQITSQAAQIHELMAQLQALHAQPGRRAIPPSSSGGHSGLQSPVLSPSPTSTSFVGSENAPLLGEDLHRNSEANKAVEDWLSKARESLSEFDGFIGIAGAGLPQSYLLEEDFEDSYESGDEDDYVDLGEPYEDEVEIAVENAEGGVGPGQANPDDFTRNLRHKSSSSSFGSASTTGQSRKKNSVEKPAILPGEAAPFGLFGNMALKANMTRADSTEPEDENPAAGIANEGFFSATAATTETKLARAQHERPYILSRGIVTPEEVEKLFAIYFNEMNLSVSLLDPVMYTAQKTYYRSPFLFTVICAIASRFYSERPELYTQAMYYAQLAAGTALISGRKNVEMCQAYILLSLYPVPAKRWEEQRSWLYLGLAIRTATDLNLHLPNTAKARNEIHAREMLNRTRVWLNCFNVDRSTGSQYGKPPIINSADYMANHSDTWWNSSEYNLNNFDIHIAAYNSELKVMAGFVGKIYSDPHHPTGLNKEVDFEKIATETDEELKQLGDRWFEVLAKTDMTDPQNCFRTGLLRLAYSYARLVSLSYGFQHAFGKNNMDENPFLMRCLKAATDVVDAILNDVCRPSQLHYFRHGPEAQSVFVTFACTFLVKLLQPRFASYLSYEKRLEIRGLVQQVIDLLSSPEVAVDDKHGPKLYSKFLKNLLASPMARVEPSYGGSPPPHRQRSRRPKSASEQPSESTPSSSPLSFTHSGPIDHPSPAHSGSLSPAPTQAAMSFDTFVPMAGGLHPFAPVQTTVDVNTLDLSSSHLGGDLNGFDMDSLSTYPVFDEESMRNIYAMSDPSGWSSYPSAQGFLNQFQQSLGFGMDGREADSGMHDPHLHQYGLGGQ